MTPEAFNDALRELGWSLESAARFLGIHQRTARKYALGERPIPTPVERLLQMHVRIARNLADDIDETGILP